MSCPSYSHIMPLSHTQSKGLVTDASLSSTQSKNCAISKKTVMEECRLSDNLFPKHFGIGISLVIVTPVLKNNEGSFGPTLYL
ncbi:hypothetical protein AVEN_80741-1 [Araneus ventricosus]|uniref:Uncharacterized protein n=1 Tax=Araneus ventricosus TaxID=182803 RepID=A0A4Y2QT87_ARAVE|nr:hypothetical protein AVEN_80741-1 [Araneus ventricosus]